MQKHVGESLLHEILHPEQCHSLANNVPSPVGFFVRYTFSSFQAYLGRAYKKQVCGSPDQHLETQAIMDKDADEAEEAPQDMSRHAWPVSHKRISSSPFSCHSAYFYSFIVIGKI